MQVSLVHHFTHNQQLCVQESNEVQKASVKFLTTNLSSFSNSHTTSSSFMPLNRESDYLTGSEVVMIPITLIMLGCLNCPMMTASCRNFTLSSSVNPPSRDFTATSTPGLLLDVTGLQTPRFTVPNCPLPRNSRSLQKNKEHSYQCKQWASGLRRNDVKGKQNGNRNGRQKQCIFNKLQQ